MRSDAAMIERAIQRGWLIPDVLYEKLAATIGNIVKTGSTKEKLAAARVLIAMSSANDRQQVQLHQHVHAVITNPNESKLDAIKREGFARLARLGNH